MRLELTRAALAIATSLALGCGNEPPPSVPRAPYAPAPSPPETLEAQPVVAPPTPTPSPVIVPAPAPATPSKDPSIFAPPHAPGQDPVVLQLLSGGSAALKTVVANPEKHRFQLLYSRVREGATPSLERHGHRVDAEYFFPASTMKVPIALATFDLLPALRGAGRPGLTRDATLRIHPVAGTAEPHVTTLARETWRALIVSDNASANRLLGVVGHREVHETLWSLGLSSARIRAGFSTGGEIDPAEVSPRIEIDGGTAELAARRSDLVLPPTEATGLDIGKAYVTDGRRVEGPLSFASRNAMRLRDLQDTLVRIVRPELLDPGAAADTASKDDLAYVRQALGTLPSESGLAGFSRNVVADYQYVPFLRGIERVLPRGRFRIFTKVGQAFGFLVANAYIVEKDTGRSFFLIASVYANPDETLNDDRYAYDTISTPALADIAEAACRHAFAP